MRVILKTVGEDFLTVSNSIEQQLPSLLNSYQKEANVDLYTVLYQIGPAKMDKEDPFFMIASNSKIIAKVVLFDDREEYETYSQDYPKFINNKNQ